MSRSVSSAPYWHKINLGPSTGDKDYFRDRLREEEGLDSYAEALRWFRKAQAVAHLDDPELQHPFIAQSQVEAMVYRLLWRMAQQRIEAGDLEGAEPLLLEAKEELEELQQRNGVNFPSFEGFEADYRDVLQSLQQIRFYRELTPGPAQ